MYMQLKYVVYNITIQFIDYLNIKIILEIFEDKMKKKKVLQFAFAFKPTLKVKQ